MKKFGNLNNRQAGALLPLSALPGKHGIGDLGKSAYDFIELIGVSGFKIWQMLPLNPSAQGNSPYTPYSSFAGDYIYISLELLVKDGLLDLVVEFNEEARRVDYENVRSFKDAYLRSAFAKFKLSKDAKLNDDYERFLRNAFWLDQYAAFMAVNLQQHGKPWPKWPQRILDDSLEEERNYQKFLQFIFFRQFEDLKTWAHYHDVALMGDIPFYVGLDSADVYFNRDCFLLDKNNEPLFVSGASPDYFTDEGQLWGHPIYDWKHLEQTDYQYWVERLKWNGQLFDILRIDHFRAFDTYWQVPAHEPTARNGKWIEGPGEDFFTKVVKVLPDLNIVVEDLGELRDEVHQLRDRFKLMGMRIIQYGFGENEQKEGYKVPKWSVAYSGTHDNNPICGWEDELGIAQKFGIVEILESFKYPGNNFCEKVYYRVFACEANIAIVQVQDILGLDGQARFNLPGTVGDHNWTWKLTDLKELENKVVETRRILKQTRRI